MYSKPSKTADKVDQTATNRRLILELVCTAGIWVQIDFNHSPGNYGGMQTIVVNNTLNRQFYVVAPDRVSVGNITNIKTYKGFLYLAVVIDLYSRRLNG